MSKRTLLFIIGILAALLTMTAACVGMHGQSTLDAIQGSIQEAKPIIEAYIEYPGPQDRWAGPGNLIVHVTARGEGKDPEISFSPHVFQAEAGVQDFTTPVAKKSALTTQVVRERLGLVAAAMTTASQAGDDRAPGCLSPVRVRLIKNDGGILEKHGCRSLTGWTFQAADAAADLIAAASQPPAATPRTPASVGEAKISPPKVIDVKVSDPKPYVPAAAPAAQPH
jgi:hypothetical protein